MSRSHPHPPLSLVMGPARVPLKGVHRVGNAVVWLLRVPLEAALSVWERGRSPGLTWMALLVPMPDPHPLPSLCVPCLARLVPHVAQNEERVWIAEQKVEAEKKRIEEFKRQMEEERQIEEMRRLQVGPLHLCSDMVWLGGWVGV